MRALLARNEQQLRAASATAWAGLLLGVLVGGLGGRLAMRLLFLTSSAPRGLRSDDGFRIGQFSPVDTLNLLAFAGVLGLMGAAIYLLVRPVLPGGRWLRGALFGIVAGLAMGSAIVHPDGVDFTRLGPLWLAVGLFVAIPALFGVLLVVLVDRWTRPGSWFRRRPRRVALLPLALLAVPPVVVPAVAGAVLLLLADRLRTRPTVRRRAATSLRWAGRAGLVALAVLGAAALASDVGALT